MHTLFIIFGFISFFGLIISGALKSEYYMEYLRFLYPEKMKGIETIKDAQLKLNPEEPGIVMTIFVPVFLKRRKDKELENEPLRLTAKKILLSIYFFWFFGIGFLISFIYLVSSK